MLKTRVKTGIFLSALVLLLLYFSYLPYVLKFFAAGLNLMGTFELYRAAGCKSKWVPLCISMLFGFSMPFFLPDIPQYRMMAAVVLGLALAAFFPLAVNVDVLTFQTVSVAFGSSFLISLFFSAILTLRMSQYGLYYVILMVLTSVITEVAAYFVGRAIGKHKLSPKVSPGKTVVGFVGGTTIAYFCNTDGGNRIQPSNQHPDSLWCFFLLCTFCLCDRANRGSGNVSDQKSRWDQRFWSAAAWTRRRAGSF